MMVVTENIVGAFALLGAFSLIRFRTIVKETRDIAFVFFALAIGVAVGTNNYVVAIIGTLVISGIILFLHRFNFASVVHGGHVLVILAKEPFKFENDGSWKEYIKSTHIMNIKSIGQDLREFTLGIKLKNPSDSSKLVDHIRHSNGVESVELMSGKDTVEY